MRYESKQALVDDIKAQHDLLCARLDEIPSAHHLEPGVWGDAWNLRDLVAHLSEWHFLLLGWYDAGLEGTSPPMPAAGYKWNELPRLNRAIQAKHARKSMPKARGEFEAGYRRILDIVESLSPDQILSPGHFAWTRKNPLRTYVGGNTSSHYRFAMKVIKRWRRHTS